MERLEGEALPTFRLTSLIAAGQKEQKYVDSVSRRAEKMAKHGTSKGCLVENANFMRHLKIDLTSTIPCWTPGLLCVLYPPAIALLLTGMGT